MLPAEKLYGITHVTIEYSLKRDASLQWLQTALWERHKIRTIRRTIEEVGASARLDGEGNLSMEDIPVSVVYYRAGYSPDDYVAPGSWRAR